VNLPVICGKALNALYSTFTGKGCRPFTPLFTRKNGDPCTMKQRFEVVSDPFRQDCV
jgi:hypothetical protein